jgi:hypothetical protein
MRFLVDGIPNEERIFLILILMFYDFQKPPIEESSVGVSFRIRVQFITTSKGNAGKAAAAVGGVGITIASHVAGNVAANATANAVANCCVVQ